MTKMLTSKAVENATAGVTRREIADRGARGLYLLVQPSGLKSWACRYRVDGKPVKLTIGSFPAVSLAEARQLAATALADVARGNDPAAAKREAKKDHGQDTVERLAAMFIEQHVRRKTRKGTQIGVEATFRREVLPVWGSRPITDIRRRDIADLVNAIAMTRPVLANRVLAHLSRFFKWCVGRDYIAGSPCIGVERPSAETARNRCLTDDELRSFWAATDTLPAPWGDVFKLLVLSGGRREEIIQLQWREIDLRHRLWTLPAARNKAGVDLVRPLGALAWTIIAAQPTGGNGGEFVFVRSRSRFDAAKKKLNAAMGVEDFVTHDLRRVARSLLSRARVESDVAEMCLGHVLGGVRGIYDRHAYLEEKRSAYEALEREVDLVINPPSGDVIPFRR
jgi:integrase